MEQNHLVFCSGYNPQTAYSYVFLGRSHGNQLWNQSQIFQWRIQMTSSKICKFFIKGKKKRIRPWCTQTRFFYNK